ncbi:MAG: hypothetical protein ABIZ56_00845 [Chthoniobacteraceae bacterium]
MKRLAHLILTLAVLAALGWALFRGFTHKPESEEAHPAEAAAAGEPAAEHEDFTVTLEKDKWKAIGVEMGEPEKAELAPRRIAFGRVLDPTPLVTLDSDLAAAEAVLAASRAEYERSQKLLAAGENTSRKLAEEAEAQFRADEIKADGIRRQAALQWGDAAGGDAAKRRAFVESLVHGEAALVRVDLLPGDALSEQPRAAKLLVLGREQTPIETASITPAADADARTQAQGFILRVEKPPFALRPGMALTAWLELAEKPRAGFTVPRSAVLRHDGRTWIFVQEEEEKFVRKLIALDSPMESGWFVAGEDGGVNADDLLVVTGAQALLSEEMKAAGGAAGEE